MKKISIILQRIGIGMIALLMLCFITQGLLKANIVNMPEEINLKIISWDLGAGLLILASICLCTALSNFKIPNMKVPKAMPFFMIIGGILIGGTLIAIVITNYIYGLDFNYDPAILQGQTLRNTYHIWIDQKNHVAHLVLIVVAVITLALRVFLVKKDKLIAWDI